MKKAAPLACALALAALSTTAFAADAQGGQGFIRGEVGRADLKIDNVGSDKDTSYGIGGGYWFNANWGVEGAYNNLFDGKYDEGVSVKLHNFAVGGMAKKNFGADGNGFYIGGRAGYSFSSAKVRASNDGYSYSDDTSSTGLYYGVNLGYDISRNFGLGLNYTHYKAFSDADVNNLALSAEYRF
jgi:hypothetical protein